jgi:ribosomal protein S18 acetylase RimI-like enzyme
MRVRDDAAADTAEDLGWGTVLSTPSLPAVWDMNHVRVEDPALDPWIALAEAERRGLPKVVWETAPAGGPPRGRPTREVVMIHRQAPDRAEAQDDVVALRPRERDEVNGAVLRDDPERAHTADQGVEAQRRWHRAVETVALGVRARDGALAGHAWLYRHRGVAQIEDVGVLSRYRGQGLGRALVAGALAHRRPGEELFILADAADWPQLLYERLGFRTAWFRASTMLAPGRLDA